MLAEIGAYAGKFRGVNFIAGLVGGPGGGADAREFFKLRRNFLVKLCQNVLSKRIFQTSTKSSVKF